MIYDTFSRLASGIWELLGVWLALGRRAIFTVCVGTSKGFYALLCYQVRRCRAVGMVGISYLMVYTIYQINRVYRPLPPTEHIVWKMGHYRQTQEEHKFPTLCNSIDLATASSLPHQNVASCWLFNTRQYITYVEFNLYKKCLQPPCSMEMQ